jgi:hypothetical protein
MQLLTKPQDRSTLTKGWGTFGVWFALVTIRAGGRPIFQRSNEDNSAGVGGIGKQAVR